MKKLLCLFPFVVGLCGLLLSPINLQAQEVQEKTEIVGGFTEQDPQNIEMVEIANIAVTLMQKEHSDLQLIRIHKAATQVVAGMNYLFLLEVKIQNIHSIWEIILYRNLGGNFSVVRKTRKYNLAIPGGFLEQPPEDSDMSQAAQKALIQIQKDCPNAQLVRIHKAATQVVAGINYFLILELNIENTKSLWEIFAYENFQGTLELVRKNRICETSKAKKA